MHNLVSVIVTVYHESPEYLRASLNSILMQTYQPIELIVVIDDPEATTQINTVQTFFQHANCNGRMVINQSNLGPALSCNRGIELATGEWIARMDADDISEPTRIMREVDAMRQFDVDAVTTNCSYLDANGNQIGQKSAIPISSGEIASILPIGSTLINSSALFRANSLKTIGMYRDLSMCEDYDLWLRMLTAKMVIISIDEPLVRYRIRNDSLTGGNELLLYLAGEYVRQLFYERQQANQLDSFSKEHFLQYLSEHGIESKIDQQRFHSGMKNMQTAMKMIKKKRLVSASWFFLKNIFSSKAVRHSTSNLLRYELKVRL